MRLNHRLPFHMILSTTVAVGLALGAHSPALFASGFGGADQITTIGWGAFLPVTSAGGYTSNVQNGTRSPIGTGATLVAAIDSSQVPNGAVITEITFFVVDDDSTKDFTWRLCRASVDVNGNNPTSREVLASATATGTGVRKISDDTLAVRMLYQFDDDGLDLQQVYNYWLEADFDSCCDGPECEPIALRQAKLIWHRELFDYFHLDPQPTQSFDDVPLYKNGNQNLYYNFIEALYQAGVTVGCGNGDYCPDAATTRRQSAVFTAGALGMHWPADIPRLPTTQD